MKGAQLIAGIILGILVTIAGRVALRSLCLITDARQHLIPIAQDASIPDPDEQKAYISFSKKHQITWQSTDGSPLIIEFEIAALKADPDIKGRDPFAGMTDSPDGKFRRVSCKDDECRSGKINDALKPDLGYPNCIKFKYYQQAGSNRMDGWIIVKG